MLQNVKGENGIKAVYAGVLCQSVFGVEELNRKSLVRGALSSEPHGDSFNVIISCAVTATRQFKQDFTVTRAIVKSGAVSQAQDLHIGTNAFVFQVVSGDGKEIKLGVLPVPLRHLLGI